MAVNRCLCRHLLFSDLLHVAERDGLSFDELLKRTRCCTGCGLCEPYVRLMLETGQTEFDVLAPAEVDAVMQRARVSVRKV